MPPIPYASITHHAAAIIEYLKGPRGPVACYHPAALVGAEVGVWRGKNAATLLARMPRLKLYMVDLWGDPPPDGADTEQSLQTGAEICAEALAETAFAEDRRVIVRAASPGAVEQIPEALDFVFVDTDHRYEPCLADLRAWWPKVRPGGWLFCHDIDNPADFAKSWGVRRAVEEFCAETGLELEVTPPPAMVAAMRRAH